MKMLAVGLQVSSLAKFRLGNNNFFIEKVTTISLDWTECLTQSLRVHACIRQFEYNWNRLMYQQELRSVIEFLNLGYDAVIYTYYSIFPFYEALELRNCDAKCST